jgi:hypothetical protein
MNHKDDIERLKREEEQARQKAEEEVRNNEDLRRHLEEQAKKDPEAHDKKWE